jgi:hypothetical protein
LREVAVLSALSVLADPEDQLREVILWVSGLAAGDPTFDNVRWGCTAADPEPRWILIDP